MSRPAKMGDIMPESLISVLHPTRKELAIVM